MEDKQTLRTLQKIPNVGPAFARDLAMLGITGIDDLKGKDPDRLYEQLCHATDTRQDPCVLDTFRAVVHYAETGETKKWWEFSSLRKLEAKSKKTLR
ncbi:MAG TPA: helix-hairpin-helix domain-containing protein [Fimbriimonas sp.]|nr:helix-hairpin-helix domain-containing protein [Fimbriimonas sp.]